MKFESDVLEKKNVVLIYACDCDSRIFTLQWHLVIIVEMSNIGLYSIGIMCGIDQKMKLKTGMHKAKRSKSKDPIFLSGMVFQKFG